MRQPAVSPIVCSKTVLSRYSPLTLATVSSRGNYVRTERVVNMERTNIRYVTPEDIGEEIDFASVDVSFISLKLVLPVAKTLLADNGEIVALIKPQFEAGREQVGKKGVVKDIKVHYEVIKKILDFARSIDLHVAGLSFSPIKGPEGNIEYLAYLKKAECEDNITDEKIQEIVDKSHNLL